MKKNFRAHLCAALSLLLSTSLAIAAPAEQTGKIVLTDENVDPCPVVIMTPGGQMERSAGGELADYLQKITGKRFPVTASSEPIPDRAILIGPIGKPAPKELGEEGFIIKTEGQKLYIVGGGERGTMYGVYWFLEQCLGCKWWTSNEEDIPQKTALALPSINITEKPAFELHDLYNREAQNGPGNFGLKIHANSSIQFTGGHTIYPLLKPYLDKNPLYLPMDEKGQRKANDIHLNYSAPGIEESLAEALSKEVEKRDRDVKHYIYQAGMGDWSGGMDWSPESKQIYADEAWTNADGVTREGYSAPLLRMMNRTATVLNQKYPGIRLSTFAYMSLEAPPGKTRPADNVCLWVPRLRHDTVLSIEESKNNLVFRRNIEEWVKIAPGRVYVWEYGVNFNNFMAPFPCIRSMAANIAYYHRIGVQGIMIQGNYVSTGGDLVALKNYVWSKLLWNPDQNVDALIQEFCSGYYGPASKEMIAYVNALEDSVRKPQLIHADEFDNSFKYLTPQLNAQLRGLLKQALAKTRGSDEDPFYRRVREAAVSLDSWELWNPGPLEESDGKLIRTDIDKSHGQYTLDRALETTKYSRNASPSEWGTAAYYQANFLQLQGGPLYGLHRGGLTVKVAPYNPRRIWQISLDGKTAIDGSWASLDPRSLYFKPAGQATDTAVEMEAPLGVEAWSSDVKQTANEKVELVKDNTIHIEGKVTGVVRDALKNQPSIETLYRPDKDEVITFEALVNGAWQAITFSPGAAKAAIPAATQLRVSRSARGVVVVDKYLSPGVEGGELIYNAKDQSIKTVMKLAPTAITPGQTAQAYVREIEVSGVGR